MIRNSNFACLPLWDSSLRGALSDQLAAILGAAAGNIVKVDCLDGGSIQQNVRVTSTSGLSFVLRTDAKTTMTMSHSREDEFHIMRLLWQLGYRHMPEPIFFSPQTDTLPAFGGYGYVEGEALGGVIVHGANRFPRWGEDVAGRLGVAMGTLHALTQCDRFVAQYKNVMGATVTANTLEGRLAVYEKQITALALGDEFLECLEKIRGQVVLFSQGDSEFPCLCHNDLRTGNYLVGLPPAAEGELIVLDWEFAALGDRREDLGWFFLPSWRFGNLHLPSGGVASASAFFAGYNQAYSGNPEKGSRASMVPHDEIRTIWLWQMLAGLRWAIIAGAQYQRMLAGEDSLDLTLTGYRLPELVAEIHMLLAHAPRAHEVIF